MSLSVSPPASLPQVPLFLSNQTCCFDTFVTKAHFYHYLHQAQSKRDGNVREKVWWTLFTLSPGLDLPVRPSTREVGRGVGLAASYTRTSIDSDSTLLSAHLRISSDLKRLRPDSFSHSSHFRCIEQDRTTGKIPVQLALVQV